MVMMMMMMLSISLFTILQQERLRVEREGLKTQSHGEPDCTHAALQSRAVQNRHSASYPITGDQDTVDQDRHSGASSLHAL